jgi:hypothetical protein
MIVEMSARTAVQTTAVIVIMSAAGLAAVAYYGAEPGEPGRLRYAISFSLPYAMTAVVSLVGLARDTPRHMIAAGFGLIPISVLSIVLLPLIIPALVLVGAGSRLMRPGAGWSVEIPAGLVVGLGIVASLVALLVFREDVEWSTPTSHHAGEQTTWTGSLLSWATLAVVLLAAMVRDERNRAPVGPGPLHRSPSGRRG